jgi:hypothetical protein
MKIFFPCDRTKTMSHFGYKATFLLEEIKMSKKVGVYGDSGQVWKLRTAPASDFGVSAYQ